jgi:hypothetical protein
MGYASDLVSKGYSGYQGWGDAEAQADFNATSGSGKGGPSSGGSSDPIEQAKKINQFYIEQNQPAIKSFQESIPEVQKIYENQTGYLKSQQAPLEQRYSNLIGQITKSYQTETSREFGKRGVSTESGLFDQTLNDRLSPQVANLGVSREQDISSLLNQISTLGGQQSTDIRGILNSIAQLQAGNAPQAVTSAQDIINAATQQKQFDVGTELKKQELSQSSGTDLSKYFTSLGEGSTLYDLLNNKAVYTAPKSYAPGSGGSGAWE